MSSIRLKKRNLLFFVLSFFLFGLLTACGQQIDSQQDSNVTESNVDMPSGIYCVFDITQVNQGDTYLVGINFDGNAQVWSRSADNPWLLKQNLADTIGGLNEGIVFTAATISSSADIAFSIGGEYGSKVQCYELKNGEKAASPIDIEIPDIGIAEVIDPSLDLPSASSEPGETNSIEIKNGIKRIKYDLSDGLLVLDQAGNMFRIPLTSDTKQIEYSGNESARNIEQFFERNGTVYAITSSVSGDGLTLSLDISAFDLVTGDERTSSDAILDSIKREIPDTVSLMDSSIVLPFVAASKDGETIALSKQGSLSIYQDGEFVPWMNCSNTNLASSGYDLFDIYLVEDSLFYAQLVERATSILKLFSYTDEGENESTRYNQTLKIYSLNEDAQIRQTIEAFRENNPDIKIEYEQGRKDSSISAEDAIRSLNTSLLAGNGPDILLLDGLPLSQYEEEGSLLDLAPLLDEVISDSNFFTCVTDSFKESHGPYSVPLRFTVPMFATAAPIEDDLKTSLLSSSHDIAINPSPFVYSLYTAMYNDFATETNIDSGNLETFFELSKLCIANAGASIDDTQMSKSQALAYFLSGFEDLQTNSISGSSILLNENTMEIGMILNPYDFGISNIVSQATDGRGELSILKLSENKECLPSCILSISSSSDNIEISQEFIRFALSEDAQSITQGLGLPISSKAFVNILNAESEGYELSMGDGKSFSSGPLTNDEIEKYANLIKTVDSSVVPDQVVTTIIMEELSSYIIGQKDLDDAVQSVEKRTNLYQTE